VRGALCEGDVLGGDVYQPRGGLAGAFVGVALVGVEADAFEVGWAADEVVVSRMAATVSRVGGPLPPEFR
jgi:hypothetical protein